MGGEKREGDGEERGAACAQGIEENRQAVLVRPAWPGRTLRVYEQDARGEGTGVPRERTFDGAGAAVKHVAGRWAMGHVPAERLVERRGVVEHVATGPGRGGWGGCVSEGGLRDQCEHRVRRGNVKIFSSRRSPGGRFDGGRPPTESNQPDQGAPPLARLRTPWPGGERRREAAGVGARRQRWRVL